MLVERLGAGAVTARLDAPEAAVVQPGFSEGANPPGSLGVDVAHELANLLLVVTGSLEQLRRQPLDTQGRQQLARAEWGAWQAVQLMRPVLSQAQGGDGEAEVEAADLNAIVGRFVAGIGPQIDEQVRLAAELAPGRLPVRFEPALLGLVLLNLVRDAMPDGGTVVLRTRGPRLDGLGDQLSTEVSVSDTGTGMPPGVAERAAEAFFTTKPRGKGAGLGLWMAHRFASMCGGKVTIETQRRAGHHGPPCLALSRRRRAGLTRQPRSVTAWPSCSHARLASGRLPLALVGQTAERLQFADGWSGQGGASRRRSERLANVGILTLNKIRPRN